MAFQVGTIVDDNAIVRYLNVLMDNGFSTYLN
jgi:hypothetical protein